VGRWRLVEEMHPALFSSSSRFQNNIKKQKDFIEGKTVLWLK